MNVATPAEIDAHVQLVAIADLIPNPRNARLHPEDQVDMLVGLIREFGFTNPILADLDDGGIMKMPGSLPASIRPAARSEINRALAAIDKASATAVHQAAIGRVEF